MTTSYVLNIKLSDKFLQSDTKDVLSLFISDMVTQTNL